MVNGRKLSNLWRSPFASIRRGAFSIEVLELRVNLLAFDAEQCEYPLTVRFACCHKVHPLKQWSIRFTRTVWSILLSVRAAYSFTDKSVPTTHCADRDRSRVEEYRIWQSGTPRIRSLLQAYNLAMIDGAEQLVAGSRTLELWRICSGEAPSATPCHLSLGKRRMNC
jgi:hypothetical protein